MPQAEQRQPDQQRSEDQSRTDLRFAVRSASARPRRDTEDRQNRRDRADRRLRDAGLDPLPDRTAGREPHAAGDDDADGDQPSAIPSRRWPCSMSAPCSTCAWSLRRRVASHDQPAPMPRPTETERCPLPDDFAAAPTGARATAWGRGLRGADLRGADLTRRGRLACRRRRTGCAPGGAGSRGRGSEDEARVDDVSATPVRDVDAVELDPRALVFPAIPVRLVATAPSGPSATPATPVHQAGRCVTPPADAGRRSTQKLRSSAARRRRRRASRRTRSRTSLRPNACSSNSAGSARRVTVAAPAERTVSLRAVGAFEDHAHRRPAVTDSSDPGRERPQLVLQPGRQRARLPVGLSTPDVFVVDEHLPEIGLLVDAAERRPHRRPGPDVVEQCRSSRGRRCRAGRVSV